jgi:hypothetical protein
MGSEANLAVCVLVWGVAALYLLVRHSRDGGGVGLLMTYVLSFGVMHWFPSSLHLLPWFETRGTSVVAEGMRESAFAMVSLSAGAEVMAWLWNRRAQYASPPAWQYAPSGVRQGLDPGRVSYVLVVGFVLYAVLSRLIGAIPGLQAIVATGSAVLVVGLSLEVWNARTTGSRTRLALWLAAPLFLPLVTVITQGFLGYGFAAMLTVYAFSANFLRPRWRVLVAASLLAYVGLSVYITYMRDRNDIRRMVWGGSAFTDRASQLMGTFAEMEWFDYRNQEHLDRVDTRLNQNFLVGAAVSRLDRGLVPFADGSTLEDAALSLVPRVLWPNKPVVGGSGDLVSTYTGIRFAEGTSVGVGQVLECYINFGRTGVVIGFFVIGMVLVLADRSALRALERGSVFGFTTRYLPALGLLQVGGSFAEVVSTAGAGLFVTLLMRAFAARFLPARPATLSASAVLIPPAESR